MQRLGDIAVALTAGGKGILAADESTATITKRFDSINVKSDEGSRRDYREMLFSAPAMKAYISGVILYTETITQQTKEGVNLTKLIEDAGALVGIKVDLGAKPLAGFKGETITEGLDGLRERLHQYYELGARFAKWRGVIAIDGHSLPSRGAVLQNAQALARYAALCQEANIVPIVEPEVMMDGLPGDHSIARNYEVSEGVLQAVFKALHDANVDLEGIVLKPNMVIDGKNARKASVEEVAEKTLRCLKANVPALVSGIAFLSGGQSDEEATAHLSAICQQANLPWHVTFSYGRALQASALKAWGGLPENVPSAQQAFTHRAKMNYLAAKGQWTKEQENA